MGTVHNPKGRYPDEDSENHLARRNRQEAFAALAREDFSTAAAKFASAEMHFNMGGRARDAFSAWSRRMQALRSADEQGFAELYADELEAGLDRYYAACRKDIAYKRDCIRCSRLLEDRIDALRVANDVADAYWTGQRLLALVERYPDVLDDPVAPLVLRVKLAALEARYKAGKVSIAERAAIWKRAADQTRILIDSSQLPAEFKAKIEASEVRYLADSFKFRAFSRIEGLISRETIHAASIDMARAAQLEEEAVNKFRTLGDSKRGQPVHSHYLRYWQAVFDQRLAVFRRDWRKAELTLQAAENHAIGARLFQRDDIRPHHFLTLADIHNEQLLINAWRFATRGALSSCTIELDEWLKRSEVHAGHWKYNNIRVRQLSVKSLEALSRGNIREAASLVQQARSVLTEHGSLGGAANRISDIAFAEVTRAQYSPSRGARFLALVPRYFLRWLSRPHRAVRRLVPWLPLDVFVQTEVDAHGLDPLDWLPPHMRRTLEDCLTANDTSAARSLLSTLVYGYVAAINEYVQVLSERDAAAQEMRQPVDPVLSGNRSITEIIAALEQSYSDWKERRPTWGEDLRSIGQCLVSGQYTPSETAEQFRDRILLKTVKSFFPLFVQTIKEETSLGKERIYLARRLSSTGLSPYIRIRSPFELPLSAYYALDPKWKLLDYPDAIYPAERPEFLLYRCGTARFLEPVPRSLAPGLLPWPFDCNQLRKAREGDELDFKFMGKPEKLVHWVIAFANTFGGHVIVGLSDYLDEEGMRTIEVLDDVKLEQTVNGVSTAVRDIQPGPIIPVFYVCNYHDHNGSVLIISVDPAPSTQEEPYHLGSVAYFRIALSTQRCSFESDECATIWRAARKQLAGRLEKGSLSRM